MTKTPTATKLNQNPACINAHGSQNTTATNAAPQIQSHGHDAPCHRKSATTHSMMTVRCAGKPQPLNSAYKVAKATPIQTAVWGAGHLKQSRLPRRAELRQASPTPAEAAHANKVMCKPEMLIKCATPVALKTFQSA